MCHIIHMLQSQQLILHEQQQTLKKKKIVQCSNESCHHAFLLNMHSKEKQFYILSLTGLVLFFFWTRVSVTIKRKEARLYFFCYKMSQTVP